MAHGDMPLLFPPDCRLEHIIKRRAPQAGIAIPAQRGEIGQLVPLRHEGVGRRHVNVQPAICPFLDGNLQPLTLNYLHLLVDKSRFGALQDSLEKFIELYREYKGIICATAVTAVPMSGELTNRLRDKLAAVTGKQVELTCEVDPALISGIRLQMNGEQFDSSVRRRLENLKKSIESAIF